MTDQTTEVPPDEAAPTSSPGVSRRALLRGGVVAGVGLAAATLGPGGQAAVAAPTIQLARNGQTDYQIYLGTGEDPVVRRAADDLAAYLHDITSATFTVVAADQPPNRSHLLVLGRHNPITVAADRRIDYPSLSDDGFALRTTGSMVLITGAHPRGTLYGVYWLLDRLLGVRWYSADFTHVPHLPNAQIALSAVNADHVPRFRYRQVYAGDGADPAYRQHNLLNGGRGWEGVSAPAGLDTWSTHWPAVGFGGTFHTMVTDQSLWYGGQLRCMDPTTRTDAAHSLIDAIKARIAAGEDPTYGFEQQDTGWTPDPDSQAFADAHGDALSAPIIDMVNDVATRVRREIPQARLSTQAYQFSLKPPTGLRVDDAVVMTVAPIHANFAQPLFSGDNAEIGTDIRTWCRLARDVVVWDYLTDFASYIQPYPDWWALGAGIKDLAQSKAATGYFGEAAYNAVGTEFAQLRIWLVSRLLWDPGADPDALIREFCQGYYGAAANSIYAYLQLMVASVAKTKTFLTEGESVYSPFLSFDTMRQADALMAAAEEAVRNDAALRAHVQSVRLNVDYVILIRTNEFEITAWDRGITWDPDTEHRLERFSAEIQASGLTQYTEGGGTPQQLLRIVQVANAPATPPKIAQGLPRADWVDYQDASFRLYAPVTTIIDDPKASNGYTVQMPGNRPDWGVQLPLTALPTDGTWKLYMAVRVDTGTAAPTDTAIEGGVYPPFGNLIDVPVSELADGAYHEIALPGSYQHDSTHYVYIAPPNNPDVPDVYVDRIVAVKA